VAPHIILAIGDRLRAIGDRLRAIGDRLRAGRDLCRRHRSQGCTGRWRYRTRTPPESGQDRREAHERYGGIGCEARDTHGVDPEPPEQEPAAAKRDNRYSELT
jgi:hypothetical protein